MTDGRFRDRVPPSPRTSWAAQDVPPQHGRTVVVTGATSGIGLETARVLYRTGADVVLAVRSEHKGRGVVEQLRADRPRSPSREHGSVRVESLDLADLASVRRFAGRWTGPLDVLICNAGVMAIPLQRTADGFEMQMGTNHLGHFALVNLLLPSITDRVVTVASLAERAGRIDLTDLNYRHRRYNRALAYAQSKLANLLAARHLQSLLTAAGSPVVSIAAHPGASSTGLGDGLTGPGATGLFRFGSGLVGHGPTGGALPSLFAATMALPGGLYIGPRGTCQLHGAPTAVDRSARAYDDHTAAALWALSEELTGTRFPFRRR